MSEFYYGFLKIIYLNRRVFCPKSNILDQTHDCIGLNINAKDKYGRTALDYALEQNNMPVVEALIQNGIEMHHDKNISDLINPEKDISALQIACSLERLDLVKTIIHNNNFNINHKDAQGFTALHVAVIKGNVDIVKTLINNGADTTVAELQDEINFALKDNNNPENQQKYQDILELINNEQNVNLHQEPSADSHVTMHTRNDSIQRILNNGPRSSSTSQNLSPSTSQNQR